MSTQLTWLVTGSSRGLGLELVKQLVASPRNLVIATCRNPENATALISLKGNAKGLLHIVQLDGTDVESVRASVSVVEGILGSKGLDYLYNNAGIGWLDDAFDFKAEDLMQIMETNVVAPARITQAYLPLIEKSTRKVIVNVSSSQGSIGMGNGPQFLSYCASKAALNMLTYKQAAARPDITVISLNPGWVKTNMGGPAAALEPHESVTAQLKVVTSLTSKDSGKFFDHSGKLLPW
ncbi:C-factor [Wolfiporia cocos MD-104 SS10]|uniref:C-factor n=1 Tax=Wolfiporia cocos (strain MD-104) TaxID=742152 RepID=A0A2H3JN49_WOLCO|nr:C-factor [Wolfiporia cocos MD-104 SS10]